MFRKSIPNKFSTKFELIRIKPLHFRIYNFFPVTFNKNHFIHQYKATFLKFSSSKINKNDNNKNNANDNEKDNEKEQPKREIIVEKNPPPKKILFLAILFIIMIIMMPPFSKRKEISFTEFANVYVKNGRVNKILVGNNFVTAEIGESLLSNKLFFIFYFIFAFIDIIFAF